MTNALKKYMVSPFKNRTVGYWIGLGAAGLAVLSSILMLIIDFGDRTCSIGAFVTMLVGGICFVSVMFFDFKFLPLIPSLLFILGFYLELDAALPSLSDMWNGVTFIGGNGIMGLIFSVLFAISAIASIVSCFMKQTKEEE